MPEPMTPERAKTLLDGATPGPWEYRELPKYNCIIEVASQEMIDECWSSGSGELAAAAPELAEAYLRMCDAYESCCDTRAYFKERYMAVVPEMQEASDLLDAMRAERDAALADAERLRTAIRIADGVADDFEQRYETAHANFMASEAERDRAGAAVERVRALHVSRHHDTSNGWTGEPFTECRGCTRSWPCPTIEALGGEA